jgi:hypothetical protein
MAEVLAEYSNTIVGPDEVRYRAQAVGAPGPDGRWEAWIEFLPLGIDAPIRSPRETTQPNHADAVYWANGLTAVYLEGALTRALNPTVVKEPPSPFPYFEAPAPEIIRKKSRRAGSAVLNPFSVYDKSSALLEQELHALSAWHLVNIIVAYRLTDEPVEVLNALSTASLIERIMIAVREQTLTD